MPRIDEASRGWVVIGLVAVGSAGCQATLGPRDGAVTQATRIGELESEVATLEARVADAEAALAVASAAAGSSDGSVPLGVPTPFRLVEASGSALKPSTSPSEPSVLQWRLRSEDARGRFVQATGPAAIVATALDDDGSPFEVGRWSIDAGAWRDGLREGLLGAAYALDLPLDGPVPSDLQLVLVRVELNDVRLDEPLRLESAIPVIRPRTENAR